MPRRRASESPEAVEPVVPEPIPDPVSETPTEPVVSAPEPVADVAAPSADIASIYKDRSGPSRGTSPTEGASNFSAITRAAREAAGLDPETGGPLSPKEG